MCDTLVLVEAGRVLFGKNSDRDPNEAQVLDWQPARTHAAGSTVACTWIEIPQVETTNAVLLSRPFWMWGAEMGANEHGVVIGNEAVFTDQPYRPSGLTGMDLIRLALERAASAAGAVDVITALVGAHGQGGGCGLEHRDFTYHSSFVVADASGAYVLETAGQQWAVERVDAGPRSISNGLTIEGFAAQHRDASADELGRCAARRTSTTAGAAAATGPGDVMAVLRSHEGGAPAPVYDERVGALGGPCVHAGGEWVVTQTTASWVAELTSTGARHWATATAAPCTSLFKPVRVDEPLDLGPEPADHYDAATLWWRHERFHRRVLRDPDALAAHASTRDAAQAELLSPDAGPAESFAWAGTLLEAWTEEVAHLTADARPPVVQDCWKVRDAAANLPGA